MSTIAIKLSSLLFKTLVKPVAKGLKGRASNNPWLRSACERVGRWQNRVSLAMNLRLLGHNPTKIKPVSDEKALKMGAEFLSEAVVFSSGALVIMLEYTRKYYVDKRKSALAKEKKEAEERVQNERIEGLEAKIAHLAQVHEEQQRLLSEVLTRMDPQALVQTDKQTDKIRYESSGKGWWGWLGFS